MALSYEFLIERADQAADEAVCASLENVRERALRAEAAWRAMASKVSEVLSNRKLATRSKFDLDQGRESQQ